MLIALVGLWLRMRAFSPFEIGYADEIMQYLEQAKRISTGHAIVPWEYRYGARGSLIAQVLAGPWWLGWKLAPGTLTAMLAARYSSDEGRTWTTDDRTIVENEAGMNVMSVSLLRLKSGHLLAAMRNDTGYIWTAKSKDGGKTWSEPKPSAMACAGCASMKCTVGRCGAGGRTGSIRAAAAPA